MNKRSWALMVVGFAVVAVAVLIGSTGIREDKPTAIVPTQPSSQPSLTSDEAPNVLAPDATAKSISNCVNERVSAYRKFETDNGREPVIRVDMRNEFEQECEAQVEASNLVRESPASKAKEQQTSQSEDRDASALRAAQSAKSLTPEAVVWSKHMSLGLSAETLPRTRGCDGVRQAVSNLLQQDDKMLELNNRMFKAGYRPAFDDQSRVDLLDRTSDHGDLVASQLRCPEWQQSRREVLWWFRGLSKDTSESPASSVVNDQKSQSSKPAAAPVRSERSANLLTSDTTVFDKYASLRERVRKLPSTAGCNAVSKVVVRDLGVIDKLQEINEQRSFAGAPRPFTHKSLVESLDRALEVGNLTAQAQSCPQWQE